MNVQFNTIQDKLKYALRDYTSVGKQSPFSFSFLTDEQVYQIHPERYAFYLQMLDALQDPNSGLLDRVLSIENKSRYARDQLQRTSADVAKALRYLAMTNKITGGNTMNGGDPSTHSEKAIRLLENGYETLKSFYNYLESTIDKDFNSFKETITTNNTILESIPSDPLSKNWGDLSNTHPFSYNYTQILEGIFRVVWNNLTINQNMKQFMYDVFIQDYILKKIYNSKDTVPKFDDKESKQLKDFIVEKIVGNGNSLNNKEIQHAITDKIKSLIDERASSSSTPPVVPLGTPLAAALPATPVPHPSPTTVPSATPVPHPSPTTVPSATPVPHPSPTTVPSATPVPHPATPVPDPATPVPDPAKDITPSSGTSDAARTELIQTLNMLIDASSAPIKLKTKGGSNNAKATKGGSFYTELLDRVEEEQKKAKANPAEAKNAEKALDAIADEVDSHPVFNPEFEKISMTDRVIFIAVTFMVRGLALFLIDWGINSMLITTFNRAFLYYTLIYFTLFMMWVLLVNAGSDTENIPLKMAFYYVNTGTNGIGRILVHLAVQTFLIPIPFIVREPLQGAPDTTTFEKRRAVYRVLSNFTFFVWVMTSIIALRF